MVDGEFLDIMEKNSWKKKDFIKIKDLHSVKTVLTQQKSNYNLGESLATA